MPAPKHLSRYIGLWLTPEDAEFLRHLAHEQGRSMSGMVRAAIRLLMQQHSK